MYQKWPLPVTDKTFHYLVFRAHYLFFSSNWVDFNIFCRYYIVLRYREIVWKISFTVLRYVFHNLKQIFFFFLTSESQMQKTKGICKHIIFWEYYNISLSTSGLHRKLTTFWQCTGSFFRGSCLCVSRVYKDQIVIDKYSQCGERMVQSL